MGERDRQRQPASLGLLRRTTMESQTRRLAVAALDLDLTQGEAADPERLERRLLGREACRKVGPGASPRFRVGELPAQEDAVRQPRPALQRTLESLDFDQIDADPVGQPIAGSLIKSERSPDHEAVPLAGGMGADGRELKPREELPRNRIE
jgi:hypothetical protein